VQSLTGYEFAYDGFPYSFVYVSQCCTEHTTSSAWSASQHCHRLNIQHCMWYCRRSLLCCDNWQIDLDEHLHSRINKSIATDFRTFQPHRAKRPVIRWTQRCTCVSVMTTCDKDIHTSQTHHICTSIRSHTGAQPLILGHTLTHWGTPSHTGQHLPTLGHPLPH